MITLHVVVGIVQGNKRGDREKLLGVSVVLVLLLLSTLLLLELSLLHRHFYRESCSLSLQL